MKLALVFLATIYLSQEAGIFEYECHGEVVKWVVTDNAGITVQGSPEKFKESKILRDFANKVGNRYPVVIIEEICQEQAVVYAET